MEKSALAGEGAGGRQPPFTLFTITFKVAVYAPAEKEYIIQEEAESLLLSFYLDPSLPLSRQLRDRQCYSLPVSLFIFAV